MAIAQSNPKWSIVGSDAPDVLVVGHSHLLALLSGHAELTQAERSRFAFVWSEDRTQWPQCSDEYWEFAAHHSAPSVAVVWNGNQHNAHFLLDFDRPLRIAGVVASQQAINESREETVVSKATFEALWKSDLVEFERVVRLLSSKKRCFVIGTPPPKDRREIQALLLSDEFFMQRAADIGKPVEELRVSPNEFRIALWRQIQDEMSATARELGADFVEVPSTCQTRTGLLPAGFGAPDATHANGRYGTEVLRALLVQWESSK